MLMICGCQIHIMTLNTWLMHICPQAIYQEFRNGQILGMALISSLSYEPEKPIIDTFTELKFSIENATTGDHISGTKDAVARVVVTNGQRLFNFENISVGNDGHFSVKYLFPDDGTHQAILRLDTKNSSTASSFNVFVPHQAPPNILNPFPSSPTADSNNQQITMTVLLIGIIGGIGQQ